MLKLNPFKPNAPVGKATFSGRKNEVDTICYGLYQTINGNPRHYIVQGTKGIGKTSLTNFVKAIADGKQKSTTYSFNYLTVNITLSSNCNSQTLIRTIHNELKKELFKIERFRGYWNSIWNFAQRLRVLDSGIEREEEETELVDMISQLADELYEINKRIIDNHKDSKSGILFIFDEVSEVSDNEDLGYLFKTLTERLEQKGKYNISFILVGLENLSRKINNKNSKSDRIFNEIELKELSFDECRTVLIKSIYYANNGVNHGLNLDIKMEDETLSKICELAKGNPHLLQNMASSVFDNDTDGVISMNDLLSCDAYKKSIKEK